jgi:proline-specific peptidase
MRNREHTPGISGLLDAGATASLGPALTRRHAMATTSEGTVPFRGHRTWYQAVGELPATGDKLPLLILHGGPGLPHDYLGDLARLADDGRAVVFYDQIGCGQSDHPDDASLWTMPTFVEEVAAMRDALGLERVHLLGHSWGGWLALEYALGPPSGLASLVLASTCASIPAFAAETRRLKESLPADVQDAIDRHEAEGTTDDPAYREAAMAYATRWVCRLDPWPEHVRRSFMNLSQDVYATMQGPEWNVTGNLRDWDTTARLGELELPVLVTSGRHDEMTPALVRPLVDGIRGAESVVFEESAHLAMAEEPARYRELVESFLGRVEGPSA